MAMYALTGRGSPVMMALNTACGSFDRPNDLYSGCSSPPNVNSSGRPGSFWEPQRVILSSSMTENDRGTGMPPFTSR